MNPVKLLTCNELATLLKISKVGVYRLVGKSLIPFTKVMRSLRFDMSDILAYLEKNRVKSVG